MKKSAPKVYNDKYIHYPDEICANDFNNPGYDALYRDSIEN